MCSKPCRECPFRRKSAPGYLGNGTGEDPRFFLNTIENNPIPCHLTVDWENDEEVENAGTQGYITPCIGSLIFQKNSGKLPRNNEYAKLLREVDRNTEDVFSFPHEFNKHHAVRK